MRRVLLLTLVVAASNPVMAGGEAGWRATVEQWTHLITSRREPTIDDFQRWHTHHDETEKAFERAECRRRGWVPEDKSQECLAFSKSRSERTSSEASLFYRWLRSALGTPSQGDVIGIMAHKLPGDPWSYDVVEVRFGSRVVGVAYPTGEMRGDAGIEPVSIDGVSIEELVDRHLGKRTSPGE